MVTATTREGRDVRSPQAAGAAAETTAHVWHGSLDHAQAEPDLAAAALLSPAERARARMLGAGTADLYVASHVAARRILAAYLGLDPAGLRLGRRLCPQCADPSHGPPSVLWPPTGLSYNLTASAGHWLLAVTEDDPLGIDLEIADTGPGARPGEAGTPEQAAPVALTGRELAYVDGFADPAARRAAFLRCWTRKEAVVKAIGVGLVADLRAIDVDPARFAPVTVRYGVLPGPAEWVVRDLPLGPGRHAALARPASAKGPVNLYEYALSALPGPPPPGGCAFRPDALTWPEEP
ncbi:MAG TPA: 4'-phosphopantetheinyl transferase superfamily protein [Actinocrinis sp.]|nr:4'-phosphopantetheinyl transferase superfamily protein [Actinocrinis sp.]